jgi:hypothetical protein
MVPGRAELIRTETVGEAGSWGDLNLPLAIALRQDVCRELTGH